MSTENQPPSEDLQPTAPEAPRQENELTDEVLENITGGGTPNPWKLWETMRP